jgi:hypothetical protein
MNQNEIEQCKPLCGYLLLKLNYYLLKLMSDNGLSVDDIRYLPMYEDYLRKRKEGYKVRYIYAYLTERYSFSESTIKRVVQRFGRIVPLNNFILKWEQKKS